MDKVSKEVRRKTMQAIKSKNTRLENIISKRLWQEGIRFRKNVKDLNGKPDIVIKKYKLVIFIDSCFWHGCSLHCRMPKSNEEFWETKILRNKERDYNITKYYQDKRWNILRIWEHEIKDNLDNCVERIIHFIMEAKQKTRQTVN